MTASILLGLAQAFVTAAATPDAQPEFLRSRSSAPCLGDTVLRLARSDDGLTFTDLGTVFAVGAAAPDLTVLPGGDLLALFDYWLEGQGSGHSVLAVSRSKNNGKTWSPLRLVRLRASDGRLVPGRHGDLVEVATGRYHLYFAVPERSEPAEREGKQHQAGEQDQAVVIRSAVTRNGLDYVVDVEADIELADRADLHPMAVRSGDELLLYAAALEQRDDSTSADSPRLVPFFVSADGRHFRDRSGAQTATGRFVGSLIRVEGGIRAYVTADDGVGSLVSHEGRAWKPEPGVRLAGGWDPAVAQLEDGSYLMIYCAKRPKRATTAPTRADGRVARVDSSPPGAGSGAAMDTEGFEDLTGDGMDDPELVALDEAAELGLDGDGAEFLDADVAPGDEAVEWAEDGSDPEHAMATRALPESGTLVGPPSDHELASFDEESADSMLDGDGELSLSDDSSAGSDLDPLGDFDGDWVDDWPADDDLNFAPKPDLENWVDYIEWFELNALGDVEDNAFEFYAGFMPDSLTPSEGKPEWPELNNMFTDDDYTGPPGPWDPAEHPEWEASDQAAQEVLELYREAASKEGYAYRPRYSEELEFDTADGRPLLIELMLPSLGPHRDLSKAILADAWRSEDGQVSSERMMDAFETTLRNANHLNAGPTLIESLVATAERAMVQKNARWALEHDVFDEHELEQALDVLQRFDRDDEDPAKWTRGEHAMCMQTIQHVFDGRNPDGPNLEAARKMSALMADEEAGERILEDLSTMDYDDAHEAIDVLDDYYHEITTQWRTGYPEVRAADFQETVDRYRDTNGLTRMLLPSLTRAYVLRTRSEASRRATQLAYATHLFRARQGRWPASLDELPDDYGQRMRTDPFTGGRFGYRLTEDGPMIYSASENGIDDGGIHSPRWNDEVGSDDYVFWPPQDNAS